MSQNCKIITYSNYLFRRITSNTFKKTLKLNEMKTLVKLLFFVFCTVLIVTCSKSDQFTDELNNENLKSATVEVTVPFYTEFDATYEPLEINPEYCGQERPLHVRANGSGTATHLGKFTVHFDFCAGDAGFNFPGNPVGAFVAANGDELIVSTWGKMGPPDENDPPNILNRGEFPFIFVGGTGRFEGATGEGIYSLYNYLENDALIGHGTWKGDLILIKGKK